MEKNKDEDYRVEIPREFYSYGTGSMFDQCIMCSRELLVGNTPYIIEKSVKYYPELKSHDIIYEFAICMPCAIKQKKAMSAESQKNLETYFNSRIDIGSKVMLRSKPDFELKNHVGKCIIYGTPVTEMTEYVLQAACRGSKMDVNVLPFMIGEKAVSEMAELISDQTRGEMDDFFEQYFSGPPEWRELIRKHKPVLI
ncbi:MAG: hypothetical protein OEX02_06650 [Cyclobacteriaceae bacterium]|nr:hypothetical protein [Cyclobacteriaceae bacterium]